MKTKVNIKQNNPKSNGKICRLNKTV